MKRGAALTHADVASAYARWAPVYDLAFSLVMSQGRRALADCVNHLSATQILDVGVGTGLELPLFDPRLQIVAVDLSEPMLGRCAKRIRDRKLANVRGLAVMDAMQLAFGDHVFDAAVAPYVLTVAPQPDRLLDELVRVVRPGGRIVLVNHVSAGRGPVAAVERALARHSASLGWRPSFPWTIVEDWLAHRSDVRLIERRSVSPFGLFSLIHFAKR